MLPIEPQYSMTRPRFGPLDFKTGKQFSLRDLPSQSLGGDFAVMTDHTIAFGRLNLPLDWPEVCVVGQEICELA